MKKLEELNKRVRSKLNISQTILNVAIAVTLSVLVISLTLGVRSCSAAEYGFSSPDDAVMCYRNYLKEIRETESMDTKEFTSMINKWLEVRDTVIHYLAKDTAFTIDSKTYDNIENISDSIRNEFLRLTETWKCSFADVISIKESTSPFKTDQEILDAVHDATPFFIRLDSVAIPSVSKAEAIENYRKFLTEWTDKGIINECDMLKFVANEDIYFRTFLEHLYELDDDHITDITQRTEQLCARIFREARKGNISPKAALTYMSMRTVRRLLQNSTVCVNDIKHKKMKSELQANAYLWMIIQPFMSIDQFAIATITPEERQNFKYIAEQLPKSTAFSKTFKIDQRALSYLLPQQLLKMYILTL